MKNIRKILLCIALVSCLSVGLVGCGGNDGGDGNQADNDVSVSDDANVDDNNNQSDANVDNQNGVDDANAQSDGADNAETTSSADNSANDNSVQETVAVTDENGVEVTDDNGNVVTEIVSNANASANNDGNSDNQANGDNAQANNDNSNNNSNNNDNGNNSNNNSSNNNSNDSNSNNNNNSNSNNSNDNDNNSENSSIYFAKNRYSVFLWMSDDTSNKYESGAMAEVTFKVLDDAENGDYPVEFNYIELYDTNGVEVPFTVQNGVITVGSAMSVTEQGAATSGANYRIDNATAQPGDTVKLNIYFDNNPGIAITKVEFKYDNKALEVQSISSTGAFSNEIIESNLNMESTSK